MLVMSFLLINVFIIFAAVGICFITYVFKGGTGYVAVLHHGHLRLHYRLGDCRPINAAFRYRQICYYTCSSLPGGVDVSFLPSGPHQTLWLVVILGISVILGFTLHCTSH